MSPRTSYEKVSYELRPAKQIERRMIVDAFLRMSQAGFPIRDYQYTGMGSIFFVDFIMFHKMLGIKKLVSIESSDDGRAEFNRPFNAVDLRRGLIGDYIPQLQIDLNHILWLDYDKHLNADQLSDIRSAASQLSRGSILLITTDIEIVSRPIDLSSPAKRYDYYKEQSGDYFGHGWKRNDFSASRLPSSNVKIITNAISEGLAGRGIEFVPIFNFLYADGHRMLSMGGVIAGDVEKRKLAGCDFSDASYIRTSTDEEPFQIIVPILTKKEKLHLDKVMPCLDDWSPEEFNLKEEYIKAYREIYRYYPSYVEMLL